MKHRVGVAIMKSAQPHIHSVVLALVFCLAMLPPLQSQAGNVAGPLKPAIIDGGGPSIAVQAGDKYLEVPIAGGAGQDKNICEQLKETSFDEFRVFLASLQIPIPNYPEVLFLKKYDSAIYCDVCAASEKKDLAAAVEYLLAPIIIRRGSPSPRTNPTSWYKFQDDGIEYDTANINRVLRGALKEIAIMRSTGGVSSGQEKVAYAYTFLVDWAERAIRSCNSEELTAAIEAMNAQLRSFRYEKSQVDEMYSTAQFLARTIELAAEVVLAPKPGKLIDWVEYLRGKDITESTYDDGRIWEVLRVFAAYERRTEGSVYNRFVAAIKLTFSSSGRPSGALLKTASSIFGKGASALGALGSLYALVDSGLHAASAGAEILNMIETYGLIEPYQDILEIEARMKFASSMYRLNHDIIATWTEDVFPAYLADIEAGAK